MKQNENISDTFEHHDSPSYFSLSNWKSRANSNKNNKQSESNNRSAKYKIKRKLNNYFSWELNNECMNKQIFTTSEISDNTSMSLTDTSTETELLSKEIFKKINDLRENKSLNIDTNFQFGNKITIKSINHIDSVKNEVNSKYEEPVCPDTVFCSSKTVKKTVKRYSLSMPKNDAG